jgi:putative addiction module antidote
VVHELKVTTVGNSLAVILPKEVAARLKVSKGDRLCVTETPHGIELSPHDAEFERQMEAARDIMNRYRDTLRELAK